VVGTTVCLMSYITMNASTEKLARRANNAGKIPCERYASTKSTPSVVSPIAYAAVTRALHVRQRPLEASQENTGTRSRVSSSLLQELHAERPCTHDCPVWSRSAITAMKLAMMAPRKKNPIRSKTVDMSS